MSARCLNKIKIASFHSGIIFSCLASMGFLYASPLLAGKFNPMFLKDKGELVDLQAFEAPGNNFAPGTYRVDIYLNQRLERREEVTFQSDNNSQNPKVQPILPLGLWRELGINVERLKQEGIIPAHQAETEPVSLQHIDGVSIEPDVAGLALHINIPQVYIVRQSRSYVDPSLWDDGIVAAFSNYQLNVSRNHIDGQDNNYGYLGLRNGINIGQWYLRNDSSLNQNDGESSRFSNNRTYLERDITPLKSRFAVGQLFTNGNIFDSSRFRGVALASDSGMLPDDQAGYAPVIHGIAETNATVEVRQNGYVIYSTSVSPGAFEIRDIYPSGSNGDLEVTVIESDGRKRQFTQAYSFLPVMTRQGNVQYNLALGKYDNERASSPNLFQATAVYGATNNLTTYGGVLGAEGYYAANLGIGLNSALGGMSLDITNSASRPEKGKAASGQSMRFLYSKTLSQTNTTFTMAGYRYSTAGYRTLSEHVDASEQPGADNSRQKNRLDLSINQSLGSGSLFLSAGETNYWNLGGSTRRLQVGYSGSIKDISYSLSASRTQNAGHYRDKENQIALSFSMPLGERRRSHRLHSSMTTSGKGTSNLQVGVSGDLNDAGTLSYSLQGNQFGSEHTVGAGMNWDAPAAKMAANYAMSDSRRHLDMSAAGTVVVHAGGVTFGQPVGDTFAVIEVPEVKGAGVEGSNARTDGAGHTLASYMQPYRYNWINLDTQTLGADVEVNETSRRLVPRRGAVVMARFDATSGRRVQFLLQQQDGRPVPFGAQVLDEQGNLLAVTDNQSRALVFGIPERGRLTIKWQGGQCAFPYTLPARDKALMYEQLKATCNLQNTKD